MPAVLAPETPSQVGPAEELGLLDEDDYVRAWFEEIVAAEWPPSAQAPPSTPPGARAGQVRDSDPEPAAPLVDGDTLPMVSRNRSPGMKGWGRERSPPNGPVPPFHRAQLRCPTRIQEAMPASYLPCRPKEPRLRVRGQSRRA